MTDTRAGGRPEPGLLDLITNPLRTADTVVRTGFALVNAGIEGMRALPRLADNLRELTAAVQTAQGSMDRIDSLGTFVAQELPETQHQLELLREQLSSAAVRVAELGPQLVAQTGVTRALNEAIRLLANGVRSDQDPTVSTVVSRLPRTTDSRSMP